MNNSGSKKGTILVVDDEPNVLWFISKVCQPMGYETLTAGDGLEALRYVEELGMKLDLVLLDLKMPGMDGIEVLTKIREQVRDLPVIVLTGAHEKREACEALGIEAFMQKPYSLEDLYEQIETVISEKKGGEKAEVRDLPQDTELAAKILVVEDKVEVGEMLQAALFEDVESTYFNVRWAKSGEEALKMSLEFCPDIVIVNIKLPTMWGDELVNRFKAGEGYCPRDFIIHNNIADDQALERAKKLGHKYVENKAGFISMFELLKKVCLKNNLIRKKNLDVPDSDSSF